MTSSFFSKKVICEISCFFSFSSNFLSLFCFSFFKFLFLKNLEFNLWWLLPKSFFTGKERQQNNTKHQRGNKPSFLQPGKKREGMFLFSTASSQKEASRQCITMKLTMNCSTLSPELSNSELKEKKPFLQRVVSWLGRIRLYLEDSKRLRIRQLLSLILLLDHLKISWDLFRKGLLMLGHWLRKRRILLLNSLRSILLNENIFRFEKSKLFFDFFFGTIFVIWIVIHFSILLFFLWEEKILWLLLYFSTERNFNGIFVFCRFGFVFLVLLFWFCCFGFVVLVLLFWFLCLLNVGDSDCLVLVVFVFCCPLFLNWFHLWIKRLFQLYTCR